MSYTLEKWIKPSNIIYLNVTFLHFILCLIYYIKCTPHTHTHTQRGKEILLCSSGLFLQILWIKVSKPFFSGAFKNCVWVGFWSWLKAGEWGDLSKKNPAKIKFPTSCKATGVSILGYKTSLHTIQVFNPGHDLRVQYSYFVLLWNNILHHTPILSFFLLIAGEECFIISFIHWQKQSSAFSNSRLMAGRNYSSHQAVQEHTCMKCCQ